MLGLYTPIFILQIFCFYHIYTNSKDYKWYILIAFLPLLGAIIYFYFHFIRDKDLIEISSKISDNFIPNRRIKKLEEAVEFSDTVSNRLALANEYLIEGEYARSIKHYEHCLIGTHQDDPEILSKMVQAHYLNGSHEKVVELGDLILGDANFIKSRERVAYAHSLSRINAPERAQKIFESMDIKYANYFQRLEFAKFLHSQGKTVDANLLIKDLVKEIDQMDHYERKLNKNEIWEIRNTARSGF